MAIRLTLGRRLRTDDRAGAGLVLDEEGLAGALRQHVGKMPPDQIVAATGPDRDDDFYRTVGIPSLRLCRRNAESESHKCRGDPCQRAAKSKHRIPPGRDRPS